jgi:hypothetical protein
MNINNYNTKNSPNKRQGNTLTMKKLQKVIQPNSKRKAGKRKIKGLFLKGPVPLDWLERSARLGGKCLSLGLALWFTAGLTKNDTFKVQGKTLKTLSIGRQAYYRCLSKLEKAGLIKTEHSKGCSTIITILTPHDNND